MGIYIYICITSSSHSSLILPTTLAQWHQILLPLPLSKTVTHYFLKATKACRMIDGSILDGKITFWTVNFTKSRKQPHTVNTGNE